VADEHADPAKTSNTIMNADLCPSCGESKNPINARVAHVRLGLDEAPEPIVCKCRPDNEIMSGIMRKLAVVHELTNSTSVAEVSRSVTGSVNPAIIVSMSQIPSVEVELRFSSFMSELMYGSMTAGVFGNVTPVVIDEMGCSWWSGPMTNKITKLRMRSNGELTAKMPMYVGEIMPGIKLSVSYEFDFEGKIVRPEYVSKMTEQAIGTTIRSVNVKLISRRYVCEDTISFSSEVEFDPGVSHSQIRMIASTMLNTVGSDYSLKRYIEPMYMSEARHSDHDVVDVADLAPHKGTIMIKADGMKVYVFCYPNGYVVTFSDPNLTVISYVIAHSYKYLVEISNKPDILVAEMMGDGSLIYIDTLALSGSAVSDLRMYKNKPTTVFEKPHMIVRRRWNSAGSMPKTPFSSVHSDGIVCVTESRTLRLKKPTIDLVLSNGVLSMSHVGSRIPVALGSPFMSEGSIYEFDVDRSDTPSEVVICNPTKRLIKRMPNNSDIIRRAFMSVSSNVDMSTTLYDITNASFKMRARTYEMAQANVTTTRKVIVTFGAGRFQELVKMKTSEFSYIAIDPKIDISSLSRRASRLRIVPYDVNMSMSKQVAAITNSPGNLLHFRGTSESFIMMRDVISTMSTMGIPAVFSFSISYHCRVINMLRDAGVSTFGCGFVHDNMPVSGVKSLPVSMNVIRNRGGVSLVRSIFGKSTYVEPILLGSSVPGLHSIQNALPDLWSTVDSSTIQIMSRAVIMY